MEGVSGGKPGPVGAGWGPLEGSWVSIEWGGALGVEWALVWSEGALGVVGAGPTSLPTSMASSLSEETLDISSSEGGRASG